MHIDKHTTASLIKNLRDRGNIVVVFNALDVNTLRPNWSFKQSQTELNAISSHAETRLVELGWDVIETLLPPV